jgi:hypothetical protein
MTRVTSKATALAIVFAMSGLAAARSVVEQEARSLVMAGKIGRGEARENAVAAGKCVEVGLQ